MGIMYYLAKKMKTSALVVACSKGDTQTVIRIIMELPEFINTKSKIGNSLLIIACKMRHEKIAYFLIKMGADLNIRGDEGLTALHFAIENNMPRIVEILLNNAADIRIKDDNGKRPLDIIRPEQGETYTLVKAFADGFGII